MTNIQQIFETAYMIGYNGPVNAKQLYAWLQQFNYKFTRTKAMSNQEWVECAITELYLDEVNKVLSKPKSKIKRLVDKEIRKSNAIINNRQFQFRNEDDQIGQEWTNKFIHAIRMSDDILDLFKKRKEMTMKLI